MSKTAAPAMPRTTESQKLVAVLCYLACAIVNEELIQYMGRRGFKFIACLLLTQQLLIIPLYHILTRFNDKPLLKDFVPVKVFTRNHFGTAFGSLTKISAVWIARTISLKYGSALMDIVKSLNLPMTFVIQCIKERGTNADLGTVLGVTLMVASYVLLMKEVENIIMYIGLGTSTAALAPVSGMINLASMKSNVNNNSALMVYYQAFFCVPILMVASYVLNEYGCKCENVMMTVQQQIAAGVENPIVYENAGRVYYGVIDWVTHNPKLLCLWALTSILGGLVGNIIDYNLWSSVSLTSFMMSGVVKGTLLMITGFSLQVAPVEQNKLISALLKVLGSFVYTGNKVLAVLNKGPIDGFLGKILNRFAAKPKVGRSISRLSMEDDEELRRLGSSASFLQDEDQLDDLIDEIAKRALSVQSTVESDRPIPYGSNV